MAFSILSFLSACSSLPPLSDLELNKESLEQSLATLLTYNSPNDSVGIRYVRGDKIVKQRHCSNIMEPYATLNLRDIKLNDDATVITLGKREGAIAAETGLGESKYGASFVSVQTDDTNGGRLAMLKYRLEF